MFFMQLLKHRSAVSSRQRHDSLRPRLEILEDRCLLSAGDRDSTFGVSGLVTTNIGPRRDIAKAVAIQSDQKIVVAGLSDDSSGSYDTFVARYNSDGTLDASFGSGGKVVTDVSGNGRKDVGGAIAVQPDGKIIVAGTIALGYNQHAGAYDNAFTLVRYNANGTLDTTFGGSKAKGKVITNPGGMDDGASSLVLQPDGKIVVAGMITRTGTGNDFGLLRYNANGTLDTTFGSGGIVATNLGGSDSTGDVALQGDGKIVVAGQDGDEFALVRYYSNGGMDATFGASGIVKTTIGWSSGIADIALQSDGRIVATGNYMHGVAGNYWLSKSDIALARYNSDGSLDSSFGAGGLVETINPDSPPNDANNFYGTSAGELAVQADQRILVAGSFSKVNQWVSGSTTIYDHDFRLLRFNTDGTPDVTYGSGGSVNTDFSAIIGPAPNSTTLVWSCSFP